MTCGTVIGQAGKFNICFRDDLLSSHAGLLLVKEFAVQLGVSDVLDQELTLKQRERGYAAGEAALALAYNLIAGGDCLSDLNVLRGDPGTKQLLEVETILAPTTAGEYLRRFSIGDIYDLQRGLDQIQARIRQKQPLATCTIDLDSSIYEQSSTQKQGSTKAYNGEIGYHPLFAFCAETGELLLSHLRRGNVFTSHKAIWFLGETLKRVPAEASLKLRADSGFYEQAVVNFCEDHQIRFAITAEQTAPLMLKILDLPERIWHDLEKYGVAQVAELRYRPTGWGRDYRYVVKRELAQTKQGELYWRFHVVVTNDQTSPAAVVLVWHLQHADMENRIKEHKSGFGLEKLPTRSFHANWAYLLIGQLAFNLIAWFKRLVLPECYHRATIKTLRHHLLNLAGKVLHTGRQWYLILSDQYYYKDIWQSALQKLATLSFA